MVMLKAFFDETATHDDSRVIGIGGFVLSGGVIVCVGQIFDNISHRWNRLASPLRRRRMAAMGGSRLRTCRHRAAYQL
jgi:hypothetical protein